MLVEVFFSAQEFADVNAAGKTMVVIDVLRCTTSIVTALNNSAKYIIPVSSVEKAIKKYKIPGEKVLLCGERKGKKIGNFELGNSPLEFNEKTVARTILIMTTTNGTEAILKSQLAVKAYIASFLNISAIVDKIASDSKVVLLCAGKEGRFSMEDVVCAGKIIKKLKDAGVQIELKGESSYVAEILGEKVENILEMLKLSDHGKYLESLKLENDLEMASKLDMTKIVPVFRDGKIRVDSE